MREKFEKLNNEKEDLQLGFAGKLAKIFVVNSKLSILLLLTMFVWGILSFFITPKQYNPEIVAPAFQVITEFPGASSREVEELLTKPIEDKVADIKGVDELISQSIDGGISIVTVKFYVGEDVEASKVKIIQKIYGNIDLKPIGARDPIIKDINPDDVPVIAVALMSDTLNSVELRNRGIEIEEELKKIKNISNVNLVGGRKRQLNIILNPSELTAKNIFVFEIIETLEKNNLKLGSGEIELGAKNIPVEIDGLIMTRDDLAKTVLRIETEHVVYLEDVASIVDGQVETSDYIKFNTKERSSAEVVYISAAKKKGSNASQVTSEVLKTLESLDNRGEFGDDLSYAIVRDEGATANEEIFGLVINLAQAVLIVTIILFLFLGGRAAFVVAIAIPLVLAMVFGAGYLAGQTVNRITLFALILSLGLLVDNATVIVENIVRHLKKGDIDKKYPVIKAVDEVGIGLLMSTITTLLAFFPMMFITGMMGPYMGPIAFFVPAALIFSLIIALTINPFLSYKLLSKFQVKPELKDKLLFKPVKNDYLREKKNSWFSQFCKKIKKWFQIGGKKIDDAYRNLLKKIFENIKLRKKILILVTILFVASMILPVVGIVKFRMLPKADREQFYIYLDYPNGTSVEENNRITSKVEDFLLKETEVLSVQSFIATPPVIDFNGLFKGSEGRNTTNVATLKVNLSHHNTRNIKSEKLVQELRPRLYEFLETEPGTKIKLVEDPPGPPVQSTLLIKVRGDNYEKLKEISTDIERMFYDAKEVVDVDTSRTDNQPKIILKLDNEKAMRAGINTEMAAMTLRSVLGGVNVSVLHDDEHKEQEFIHLRYDSEYRNRIEDLKSVYLSNVQGQKIPLSEIVSEEHSSVEDVLYRDGRMKTVYVSAEMGNRSVTYAVLEIYLKLLKYKLFSGTGELENISFFGVDYIDTESGEKYEIDWGGEWEITVEVFRDLGMAMMVAIFLIYIVLVAQFNSFKTPALIMMTIPLALIGVLPGFAILGFVSGIYFNATSMIGVIALAGIVVNNAIILVEYLNGFKGRGIDVKDALVEAGATRMRPIILTSLTTILGSLTIVGDPVWAGLAWSIVFGISISTVLTLVMFPLLYFVFEGNEWS